jgi:hypothetical protein
VNCLYGKRQSLFIYSLYSTVTISFAKSLNVTFPSLFLSNLSNKFFISKSNVYKPCDFSKILNSFEEIQSSFYAGFDLFIVSKAFEKSKSGLFYNSFFNISIFYSTSRVFNNKALKY